MPELNKLEAVAPPNLINAPGAYTPNHFDKYSNVLRLYFTRISSALRTLFGVNGGKYLSFPHIAAQNTTSLYASGSGVATKVLWDTLDTGSGFTLNPTSSATALQSGIYKIDFSLQFVNTSNANETVDVWLKVNGVNVTGSASKFTVPARKSVGNDGYIVAYSSITFPMDADDYVELWWDTSLAYSTVGPVNGVYMEAYAAAGAVPAIPSAIGTIAFISALP